MNYTVGIDVGSTYTKALILSDDFSIVGKAVANTGFKLAEVSRKLFDLSLQQAGLEDSDVAYVVATGFGRHMVPFSNVAVTDLTSSARGTAFLFPKTRTVLDVGGQTMKASRLDDCESKVVPAQRQVCRGHGRFHRENRTLHGVLDRRNWTARRHLENGGSDFRRLRGVCRIRGDQSTIHGAPPADIMHGAISSLVDRSLQLMRRVKMEPEYTLIGGILRFGLMERVVREKLNSEVNVPEGDMVQFTTALGAAILGHQRLRKLKEAGVEVSRAKTVA